MLGGAGASASSAVGLICLSPFLFSLETVSSGTLRPVCLASAPWPLRVDAVDLETLFLAPEPKARVDCLLLFRPGGGMVEEYWPGSSAEDGHASVQRHASLSQPTYSRGFLHMKNDPEQPVSISPSPSRPFRSGPDTPQPRSESLTRGPPRPCRAPKVKPAFSVFG